MSPTLAKSKDTRNLGIQKYKQVVLLSAMHTEAAADTTRRPTNKETCRQHARTRAARRLAANMRLYFSAIIKL